MKTIYKYPLMLDGFNQVELPKGSEILTVRNQAGVITIWAIVDPTAEKEKRTFEVLGTGQMFSDNVRKIYIGTVEGWPYLWHVFEVTGENKTLEGGEK